MLSQWYGWAMLATESQQVIGLRLARIAQGGPLAAAEAQLMISEKVFAAMQASGQILAGASPDSVVRAYRRKVRANARRLMKQ